MKKILFLLIIFFFITPLPRIYALQIFGTDMYNLPSAFYQINSENGDGVFISEQQNRWISDITFGPDGFLYGTDVLDASPEGLIKINPVTGDISSFIPYFGDSFTYKSRHDLTFDSTGDLYLMNNGNVLSKIDINTGEVIFLGSLDISPWGSGFRAIDFAPDGTLYGIGLNNSTLESDILATINLADFSITTIGTVGNNINAMRFSDDGTLYAVDNTGLITNPWTERGDHLITINPTNGDFDVIGFLSNNPNETEINGIAIRNTPVPEPATIIFLGLGLLGLAGVSRKKHGN